MYNGQLGILICVIAFFWTALYLAIFIFQHQPKNRRNSIFENLPAAQFPASFEDGFVYGRSRRGHHPCSMATCFNFSKCMEEDLKIYVYPDPANLAPSQIYSNILKVIRESRHFTANPSDACLFVPSIDTTDRDRISQNYVPNIASHFKALPKEIWNDGLNHVIFNLYFGTYTDYANTNLGFDTGKAMLAWTSASYQNFRQQFDVSIPLFHKEHPLRSECGARLFQLHFPDHDQYLVSFKGKRYVYGIGSETRDILHHLHNNRSMLISTTCRHNTDWKKFEDERCALDNAEYDRWDYNALMANSTFCLTPRGRRLGSFRFLESLRSSCIPVVFSDDWILPFDELIDWSDAAIIGNEKSVLFIYDVLSQIPEDEIFAMRYSAQMLYQKHFADVERIVMTTIELIFRRIQRHLGVQKAWQPDGCHQGT